MNTIPETLSSSVKSNSSNQTFQNDRKRRDNINDRIQELLRSEESRGGEECDCGG